MPENEKEARVVLKGKKDESVDKATEETKEKLEEVKEKAKEFGEQIKEIGEKFLALLGVIWVFDQVKEKITEIGEASAEAARLAEDHASVLLRLNAGFSMQPHLAREGAAAWGEATDKVEELAEHIEKISTFSKKVSEDAGARMAVLGFTPEGIEKILPVLEATEIRMGNLHASSDQLEGDVMKFLRAASTGMSKPLLSMGIVLSEAQKKHLKTLKGHTNEAFKYLLEITGKYSEYLGKSLELPGAKWQQFLNTLESIQTKMGGPMLDALDTFGEILGAVFGDFNEGAGNDFIGFLHGITQGFKGFAESTAIPAWKEFVKDLNKIKVPEDFAKLGDTLQDVFDELIGYDRKKAMEAFQFGWTLPKDQELKGPIEQAAEAVKGLTGALQNLADWTKDNLPKLREAMLSTFGDIGETIRLSLALIKDFEKRDFIALGVDAGKLGAIGAKHTADYYKNFTPGGIVAGQVPGAAQWLSKGSTDWFSSMGKAFTGKASILDAFVGIAKILQPIKQVTDVKNPSYQVLPGATSPIPVDVKTANLPAPNINVTISAPISVTAPSQSDIANAVKDALQKGPVEDVERAMNTAYEQYKRSAYS